MQTVAVDNRVLYSVTMCCYNVITNSDLLDFIGMIMSESSEDGSIKLWDAVTNSVVNALPQALQIRTVYP